MVLFQPGIDSLTVVQKINHGYSVWFTIEILVIVSVIFYQLYNSLKIYKNIRQFKEIFSDRLSVISGYIEKSDLEQERKGN